MLTPPIKGKWLCEHLRVSFMGPPELLERQPGLWKALMTEEPATRTEKPLEASLTEEGACGDARLIVTSFPGRVDIILGASAQAEMSWPSIGEPVEAVALMQQLLKPMASKFLAAERMAVGMVVMERTADRVVGYSRLSQLVPQMKFTDDLRDFHLQVNYPSVSKIDPFLSINRLSRWMAGEIFMMKSSVSGNQMSTGLGSMVRCELDINTSDSKALKLDGDGFENHLNELFENMGQILDGGANA